VTTLNLAWKLFLLWTWLIWSSVFTDGLKNNPNVAKTRGEAVLSVANPYTRPCPRINFPCVHRVSIPLAIFSYIGVELLTVTAFEAAQPSRLKGPTKHIAYIITVIYLVSIGGFVANLEWFNQNLPTFFEQSLVSLDSPNVLTGPSPHKWGEYANHDSAAAPIIALLQVGLTVAPQVINGILIYAGISTANTALYVASRTLYGLTRDLSSTSESKMVRLFAKLNTVSPTTRIPVWALIVSCLVFSCWTPFIDINNFNGIGAKEVSNPHSIIGHKSYFLDPRVPCRHWQCRVCLGLGVSMPSIHPLSQMVICLPAIVHLSNREIRD
jgi:yeast amino acid transporter